MGTTGLHSGEQSESSRELALEIHTAANHADQLQNRIDRYTVNTTYDDEDSFFSTSTGVSTIVTRYDLEKEVERVQKPHFEEIDRYWVTKPYAFIILFRSRKENEIKYYAIEPHLNPQEERVIDFLQDKLKETIKFEDEATRTERTGAEKAAKIEKTGYELLLRYGLIKYPPVTLDSYDMPAGSRPAGNSGGGSETGFIESLRSLTDVLQSETETETETETVSDGNESGVVKSDSHMGSGTLQSETNSSADSGSDGVIGSVSSRLLSLSPTSDSTPAKENTTDAETGTIIDKLTQGVGDERDTDGSHEYSGPNNVFIPPERMPALQGSSEKPDEAMIAEHTESLTQKQAVKIMYYLKRDAVGFSLIDPIKHDIQIEDISCDGYNQNVWVYHESHEQIITNISHGKAELDDFVVNIAQRSGKGVSKRKPQVDVTLPDGSRGQLTLGDEISDRGTNYTIRQFNEVPYTPVDLVNWKTFDPEQMAFLWLAIENEMSMIIAGGTASGKTTSLNAISLFIPSNTKIVSIEDTREVELPQQNWVASVTRASFTEDGVGEVDEFDLLEAALRQRPDYIVMGEIRGEEGRTLFQVMSTGHTTYTTFHADSVGEVIKRFTTDPINVSKTLFTSVDLVSIQTQTRVAGSKARRSKVLTEVNDFKSRTGEINVSDVYSWNANGDTFERAGSSSTLEQIKFDRGWGDKKLHRELEKREVVLAYLIINRISSYTNVAATVQAFLNGPEIVLDLIANGLLEDSLDSLQDMESVEIDIDPETENMVPRPEPPEEVRNWATGVLEKAFEDGEVLAGRDGIDSGGAIDEILMSTTPTNEGAGNSSSYTDSDSLTEPEPEPEPESHSESGTESDSEQDSEVLKYEANE